MNDLIFGRAAVALTTRQQASALLVIYSLGFAGVYLAFTLLYFHAWRLRDALELSELEKFDTRYLMVRLGIMVAFGLIIALLTGLSWIPVSGGYLYFLIFPALKISRMIMNDGGHLWPARI